LISPSAVLHVPSTIMHQNLQRLPAERVRHRKRLPFQGWPDAAPLARQNTNPFTFTGPITITQIIPVNTANTETTSTTPVVPPTTSSVTPSLPSDTNPIVSVNSGLAQAPPTPIASAINPAGTSSAGTSNSAGKEGALNGQVSAVSNQHGLPTGAIVGITIACVMLILGAFIFFIRQRAVRNRKLRQTTAPWVSAPRPTNSSFEPAPYMSGSMGETSPGVTFARAQAQAVAAAPVPVMPAPVPSSYNNPAPAAVPAAEAPATVLYEFIPSLPDELSITTGEVVRVVSEYDDGWALCRNARGDRGMVPLECLDRASAPKSQLQVQDSRNSRRTSSLAVGF